MKAPIKKGMLYTGCVTTFEHPDGTVEHIKLDSFFGGNKTVQFSVSNEEEPSNFNRPSVVKFEEFMKVLNDSYAATGNCTIALRIEGREGMK